ncbi:MAG: helix-turn-helix domain-containing protein [Deltaproteobacteria bacterium]|nr:helix-turn-helix domain-containing protein [Deltaproteobacteria bacterium]
MLLRTTDVAKLLSISKATLETWRSRGGGPAFVKYDRAVRYRKEDIDRFISERIRENTSCIEA